MKQSRSEFPSKLAKPALRALSEAGITKLEQLTEVTESDLKKLHGMGPKAMEQLRTALNEKGLSFAIEHKKHL
jgi:DNA-directed RNA polymerase alpha subunit